MKICSDGLDQLVLSGRRQDRERGQEGLWLVWVAGSAMVAGAGAIAWRMTEGGSRVPLSLLPPLIAVVLVAMIGMTFLVMGVWLSFQRESLVLDLRNKRGVYQTFSPRSGSRTRQAFDFDDALRVTLDTVEELVTTPSTNTGTRTHQYLKWRARLWIRPRRAITLARSQNEHDVRNAAIKVAQAVDVELVDRSRPSQATISDHSGS